MSQSQLLSLVVSVLERLGVEYMITGSIASSLQGEPRATHDIDMVVSLHDRDIDSLAAAFPADSFYLDPGSIREAVRTVRMFNLIDFKGGGKVDFWILSRQPFDDSRFSRRIRGRFLGIEAWVTSPEDTIVAKLRWAKLSGGSEKQFRDALRVFETQLPVLDRTYIGKWAQSLDLDEDWKRLQDLAIEL